MWRAEGPSLLLLKVKTFTHQGLCFWAGDDFSSPTVEVSVLFVLLMFGSSWAVKLQENCTLFAFPASSAKSSSSVILRLNTHTHTLVPSWSEQWCHVFVFQVHLHTDWTLEDLLWWVHVSFQSDRHALISDWLCVCVSEKLLLFSVSQEDPAYDLNMITLRSFKSF